MDGHHRVRPNGHRARAAALVAAGIATLVTGASAANAELIPNDVAQARKAAKAAKDVRLGTPVKFQIAFGGPKVIVLVRSFELVDPDGSLNLPSSRAIKASVRVENPGSRAAEIPDMSLYCRDDPEGTSYYAQSTVHLNESLAPRSFEDGLLYVGYPEGCAAPALRVEPSLQVGGKPRAIEYPLSLP